MPGHESEGSVRIGRYDVNTSRYNDIKSYVSSTESSNYLKFSVHGGVENATVDVMTLKGNGNVGIGTTSPNAKIDLVGGDVTGGLKISADKVTSAFFAFGADANETRITSTSYGGYKPLTIHTGGSEKMRITSAGNVGIGTTSPAQKLHVAGNMRLQNQLYDSTNSQGTVGQILSKVAAGTQWIDGSAILGVPDGSGTANYTARWIDTDTLGTGVLYDNGTNVGIGTTSPDYKLEVNGTLGVNRTDGIIFAGSLGSGTGNKITADTSNNFAFSTSLPSAPYTVSERMRITNAGNVGLGTTSPNLKLDVISGTNNGIRISATDTTSNWRDIDIRSYVSQAQANALPDGSAIYTTNPTSQTETAFSKFGGLVFKVEMTVTLVLLLD